MGSLHVGQTSVHNAVSSHTSIVDFTTCSLPLVYHFAQNTLSLSRPPEVVMDDRAYIDFDDYDDDSFGGILYPLSIFFALGIWLVIHRYHSMRNRAVPFRVRAPEVRLTLSQYAIVSNTRP